MDGKSTGDPAIRRALIKRTELQKANEESERTIQAERSLIASRREEIAELDQFLKIYDRFAAEVAEESPPLPLPVPLLAPENGLYFSQDEFESLARSTLVEHGSPMSRWEIAQAFGKRGHPIGGYNEEGSAKNKLTRARKNGTVFAIPGLGYWLTDTPCPTIGYVPGQRLVLSPEVQKLIRQKISATKSEASKRPIIPKLTVGQPSTVTLDQKRKAGELLAGGASLKEAARQSELSVPNLYKYTRQVRDVLGRDLTPSDYLIDGDWTKPSSHRAQLLTPEAPSEPAEYESDPEEEDSDGHNVHRFAAS